MEKRYLGSLVAQELDPAHPGTELMEHLERWRIYYHFVRYPESLEVMVAISVERKGKQQALRYRRRTPAYSFGHLGGWVDDGTLDGKGIIELSLP